MVAVMEKKKNPAIRINPEIHRQLVIVSSITGEEIGEITNRLLGKQVEELYQKAMEQEHEQVKKKKRS